MTRACCVCVQGGGLPTPFPYCPNKRSRSCLWKWLLRAPPFLRCHSDPCAHLNTLPTPLPPSPTSAGIVIYKEVSGTRKILCFLGSGCVVVAGAVLLGSFGACKTVKAK